MPAHGSRPARSTTTCRGGPSWSAASIGRPSEPRWKPFSPTPRRCWRAKGIGLQVVGEAEPAYLETLRRRFPVGRFRRPGRRRPALHAPGAARAGAGPSGRLQAQGAGLRVQPPADPRHAHCLAGHAAGGREEHRPVRQPCRAGRRRGRADRRFPAAECAGRSPPTTPAPIASTGGGSATISCSTLAKAERLSPTARRDASTFAAASRSAHLAAGR